MGEWTCIGLLLEYLWFKRWRHLTLRSSKMQVAQIQTSFVVRHRGAVVQLTIQQQNCVVVWIGVGSSAVWINRFTCSMMVPVFRGNLSVILHNCSSVQIRNFWNVHEAYMSSKSRVVHPSNGHKADLPRLFLPKFSPFIPRFRHFFSWFSFLPAFSMKYPASSLAWSGRHCPDHTPWSRSAIWPIFALVENCDQLFDEISAGCNLHELHSLHENVIMKI